MMVAAFREFVEFNLDEKSKEGLLELDLPTEYRARPTYCTEYRGGGAHFLQMIIQSKLFHLTV